MIPYVCIQFVLVLFLFHFPFLARFLSFPFGVVFLFWGFPSLLFLSCPFTNLPLSTSTIRQI